MSFEFFSAPINPMISTDLSTGSTAPTMVAIDCCDRWQVYFRLKSLDIPCQCSGYQPLLVDIQTPYALIQVWSTVKQVSTPRLELAQWLDQCWHRSY